MRPNVLIQRLPSLVALVAIASATGCADERKGPATGSLDGKCYPNGTCNPGLECQANGDTNVCVEAPNVGSVGGLCYENGTCNPGLLCVADRCEVDATIPVGTIGGACYANGTCNPELICNGQVCEVDNSPRRGLVGGLCYDNGTCNPGLVCVADKCEVDDTIPSGTIGGACLQNGTCNAGLLCVDTVCEVDDRLEVGTSGAPCFPNGTCDAGLICVVTTSADPSSAECTVDTREIGALDQPCFANSTCKAGLMCDRVTDTCVDPAVAFPNADGTDGGLCYANGTCDEGLVCNSMGLCQPVVAGGLNGDCLPNAECNLGLSCYPTDLTDLTAPFSCQPTIEHLGSIHGVVTDYINNARLANIQVTMIHLGRTITTTTDDLGYYGFDNLLPGHFEITFSSPDGSYTTRRFTQGEVVVACDLWSIDDWTNDSAIVQQDRECNQRHDIDLFPFTGEEWGTVYYAFDQEVVPAAGVTVIADYSDVCGCTDDECSGDGCWCANLPVDISPDRFITTTDANGQYHFTDLANTGKLGVYITVMPSVYNGFDMESYGPERRYLDVFVGGGDTDPASEGAREIFLHPNENAPILVANNWEDFLYRGFDVTSEITGTFSRTMKASVCDIRLCELNSKHNADRSLCADTAVQTADRQDGDWCNEVPADLTWDNDMSFTLTPRSSLDSDTDFYVYVDHCESAGDDQPYLGGDTFEDPYDDSRHRFHTQEGIVRLGDNSSGTGTCDTGPCFTADSNIVITFSMPVDLSADGTSVSLYRLIPDAPGHSNPDEGTDNTDWTRVPVAATVTVDGNNLVVDPDTDLVRGASYVLDYSVFSAIPGDGYTCQHLNVTVCPTGNLRFLFSDLPLVSNPPDGKPGNTLEAEIDPATGAFGSNITLTYSKDVNLAVSIVTLEEGNHLDTDADGDASQGVGDNGFILATTLSADGPNIIIDPDSDLPPGDYTVRYEVYPVDTEGSSFGAFTFKVKPPDISIEFLGTNLENSAGLLEDVPFANCFDIELDFSVNVDTGFYEGGVIASPDHNRTLIEIIKPNGKVMAYADYDVTADGKKIFINPLAPLAPDSDYTINFKVYALADDSDIDSGHATYVQSSVTFHTAGHITLASTSIGDYSDSNGNGFFQAEYDSGDEADPANGFDNVVAAGPFTVTFTEAPDVGPYHQFQFVRLYLDDANTTTASGHPCDQIFNPDLVTDINNEGMVKDGDGTDDFVAATMTTAGNVVTITPAKALQAGRCYWIDYEVTSALLNQSDAEDCDLAEDVSEHAHLWFQVAGAPQAVDPVAPTTAPASFVAGHIADNGDADLKAPVNPNLVDFSSGGPLDCGPVALGDVIGLFCALDIQWTRVPDTSSYSEQWYEVYGSDLNSGRSNDSLLINTYLDDQATPPADGDNNPTRQTEKLTLCDGPFGAIYCFDSNSDGYADTPFSKLNEVVLRIRACNDDGCGPFSAPVTVKDLQSAVFVGFDQVDIASSNNTTAPGGASFNITANDVDPDANDPDFENWPVNDTNSTLLAADCGSFGAGCARFGIRAVFSEPVAPGSTVVVSNASIDPNPARGGMACSGTVWNDGTAQDLALGLEANQVAIVTCTLAPGADHDGDDLAIGLFSPTGTQVVSTAFTPSTDPTCFVVQGFDLECTDPGTGSLQRIP